MLLLIAGTEVQNAQKFLQQKFLKDSFPKRKLWFGAPELPKFDRKFGIVQNAPVLSALDYTSCYEMMDQFPLEVQKISMKSMLNKIAQRESRVFIFKGPPGCGKTELMSRICKYWAKQYAMRQFSLVLYVNIWDLHQGCSLVDLIDRVFKGSTVSSERICCWIEEEKGNEILFILDGFCHKYLYQSPLQEGNILSTILSGRSSFFKSTVVISTTCSDFVKPFCNNFTQFDILGLSDEQVGKQVIQHFDSERAFNFLSYLAENSEIKGLVSSPGCLIGTVYIFAHISYDNLPVTWIQLYTSLVVLLSEWHKRELSKDLVNSSMQSQFRVTLLQSGRKLIEDLQDLSAAFTKPITHNAKEFDHELPDHNTAVPYLEYFLSSLDSLLNPDHNNLVKILKDDKNVFAYFWYFYAGLGAEFNSELLRQYYWRNLLKTTNCLSEARCITAEHQTDLYFLRPEVYGKVVTTRDIHSILHCLPHMQDPHTVVLDKCFLGTQAVRELIFGVCGEHHSGIRHLW